MLNLKKTIAILVAAISIVVAVYAAPVMAHGEKSQAAYLRMRTLLWYDVEVSTTKLMVNDELVMTGKFYWFYDWPANIAKPEVAFLNIGIPGPVFVRKASYINGVSGVNSTRFEIGSTYEFKVVLKARRAARIHMHALMNVEKAGPLIGPGRWVEVTGDMADFSNEVTTLTGETIDLETYGLQNSIRWHVFWGVVAAAWLLYWLFQGPILIPRYKKVKLLGENADEMITSTQRTIGLVLLIGTVVVVTWSYYDTQAKYPITIPLQSGRTNIPPLPDTTLGVRAEVVEARYRVSGRALEFAVNVTNNTNSPIRLGEFTSANIRWMNPDVSSAEPADSHDPVATNGLKYEGGIVYPGETKLLKVTCTDAAWETHRLAKVVYDPDSRFGGLLFFFDNENKRSIVAIGGPLVPVFI
ncbi:MAG: bacterial ammonia monooxygenase, subunit AmoB [Cycloclasticus sp.]